MKVHTVNLKQDNMLCHRCVLNVVKALGYIDGIREFVVRQAIMDLVNESIIKGKVNIEVLQ